MMFPLPALALWQLKECSFMNLTAPDTWGKLLMLMSFSSITVQCGLPRWHRESLIGYLAASLYALQYTQYLHTKCRALYYNDQCSRYSEAHHCKLQWGTMQDGLELWYFGTEDLAGVRSCGSMQLVIYSCNIIWLNLPFNDDCEEENKEDDTDDGSNDKCNSDFISIMFYQSSGGI